MDFFEAQARAKKRSSRLVVMFILAVLGTIVATYLAVLFILGQVQGPVTDGYGNYVTPPPETDWWNPSLFGGVAVATLAIVTLGSLFKWGQFSAGGTAVAESVGGRQVDPNTRDLRERRLLNVVEEMAIASGVPVPAVYVMDEEPGINAFAAGLTTNDAAVAVTRGTLEKLNRDELQGVIAHEFSHILNGDMRLNLRLAALIFGILVLGIIGRGILWSLRGTRVRNNKNGGGTVAVIVGVGLALIIIGYIGYFFGRLIQAAVSRQREFLADASAVQFTRNPTGISGALKKIGGYALGSSMQSNQSAAIGHFFFSQAFKSGFTGLWATHPPLEERIRAIEPNFDGKFFEPPERVDVERESFVSAGLAGRPTPATAAPSARAAAMPPILPAGTSVSGEPPLLQPTIALAALASSGVLTGQQISEAHSLLEATPAALRDAAHETTGAKQLLYGLLLGEDPEGRARQKAIVSEREPGTQLDALEPLLAGVREEQRLPLVQLAIPALRQLPPDALQHFLGTLDALIHADSEVTPFEFALQRLVTHALVTSRQPKSSVVQYYSFNAVIAEIGVVLSVLARAASSDEAMARTAFSAGAAQIKLVESQLVFDAQRAGDFSAFAAALDKLANASLPIKQRTLVAAAHAVQADGQVRVSEFELLRAIAASLDVPMPALAASASRKE